MRRPSNVAVACAAVLAWLGGWQLVAPAIGDICSAGCEKRVQIREAHVKWRAAVNAYPAGVLAARARCESGGHGLYSLTTTGNGFYFAFQFEPRAWAGAGGRIRGGIPVGRWTRQPSRLEQQLRAIIWERKHGGDAWPNCP